MNCICGHERKIHYFISDGRRPCSDECHCMDYDSQDWMQELDDLDDGTIAKEVADFLYGKTEEAQ